MAIFLKFFYIIKVFLVWFLIHLYRKTYMASHCVFKSRLWLSFA